MTFLESKQALARKLDIDFTDIANNDVFSLTDLESYIISACYKAWDFESWDWSEHSKTATLLSADITRGYVSYPNDIAPSSIEFLVINGKEFKKKDRNGYKRYFENNATATDKYWYEFKRLIFFNVNAVSAGEVIDIYGKKNFVAPTADADLLPFSPDTDNEQFSGNDAIVRLAYAEALSSDKKNNPSQGAIEEKNAYGMLSILANALKAGRSSEQTKDQPMFDVPDFYANNQGSTDKGRFSRS